MHRPARAKDNSGWPSVKSSRISGSSRRPRRWSGVGGLGGSSRTLLHHRSNGLLHGLMFSTVAISEAVTICRRSSCHSGLRYALGGRNSVAALVTGLPIAAHHADVGGVLDLAEVLAVDGVLEVIAGRERTRGALAPAVLAVQLLGVDAHRDGTGFAGLAARDTALITYLDSL